MKHQVVGDYEGPWAIVFDRSPFRNGELLDEEKKEIEEALERNGLTRDEQRPDVVTHDTIRVRVKPQDKEEESCKS